MKTQYDSPVIVRRTQTRASSIPASGRVPGPEHPLLQVRQAIGNHAFGRIIQAKLADHIMRMPDRSAEQPAIAAAPGPVVQRKCFACDEEEGKIQRKEAGDAPVAQAATGNALPSNIGAGKRLPRDVRAFYEPRLGQDLSEVRVHTGGRAAESAQSLNALAYTFGRDVVFGAGQYNPRSAAGQRLLAHELAHTVQQSRGGSAPALDPRDPLERYADLAAAELTSRDGPVSVFGASAPGIARQPTEEEGEGSGTPPDVVTKTEVREGGVIITAQQIVREGLYSKLVTTFDPATGVWTRRLYRRDDHQNPDWTDVTKQALGMSYLNPKGIKKGELSVEWNMPTLESDEDRVRKIEGPGLMWGFAPFIARGIQEAYLKDQTLGIKDPYLRFRASTTQQGFKAIDEWNQRLEEFALTSIVPELPGAARAFTAPTIGARMFAQMTAKTAGKEGGAIGRFFSWLFKGGGSAGRQAGKTFLTEQEAVLAVIKDGKILAQTSNSSLSHATFVQRALGTLPEGAEVVTIGKLDGVITALRSRTFHGNELPASQAAIDAARKAFE